MGSYFKVDVLKYKYLTVFLGAIYKLCEISFGCGCFAGESFCRSILRGLPTNGGRSYFEVDVLKCRYLRKFAWGQSTKCVRFCLELIFGACVLEIMIVNFLYVFEWLFGYFCVFGNEKLVVRSFIKSYLSNAISIYKLKENSKLPMR